MLEEGSCTPAVCSSMSWRAWIFQVDEYKLVSAGHVLALGWVDPKGCFPNLSVYTYPLGILLKMKCLIQQVWARARDCISNRLPGDADPTAWQPQPEQVGLQFVLPKDQLRGPCKTMWGYDRREVWMLGWTRLFWMISTSRNYFFCRNVSSLWRRLRCIAFPPALCGGGQASLLSPRYLASLKGLALCVLVYMFMW